MSISRKITPDLLDFWLQNGLNVLFEGRHGVGKTAVVKECFERHGLKWRYYSAALMDPWTDLVGVPKVGANNTLDYILPKDFAEDKVEAIFFDEFNRSHKKVRDAVMELIQFKTINGRPFKNLKVVWAAINPPGEDDKEKEYQVEELDPALKDRFHIYVQVPFVPDPTFFRKTFGDKGKHAVEWWKDLPTETAKLISPRRLEYALTVYNQKGNMSYVLPREANIKQLTQALEQGTISAIARKFMVEKDDKGATSWLADANNLDAVIKMLGKNKTAREFFVPLIPQENLVLAMSKNTSVLKYVVDTEDTHKKHFGAVLDSIITADQNKKLIRYIRKNRKVTVAKPALKLLEGNFTTIQSAKLTTSRWNAFSSMIETVTNWDVAKVKNTPILERGAQKLYVAMLHLWMKSQEGTVQYNYRYNRIIKKARNLFRNYLSRTKKTKLLLSFLRGKKAHQDKIRRLSKKFGI